MKTNLLWLLVSYLQTHEVDLRSKLGMRLKREMLTVLANKSMYPNDPEKREKIYEKYKEFILPVSMKVSVQVVTFGIHLVLDIC